MASKKRESEGIALLSMYADDDDDDDDMEEQHQQQQSQPPQNDAESKLPQNDAVNENDFEATITSDRVVNHEYTIGVENVEVTNSTSKNFTEIFSTTNADGNEVTTRRVVSRSTTERLTIVDYGHDEAALSPEPEEGERGGTGHVMFGVDLHMSNGELSEQISQGTMRILTPSTQATPQSSGQHGESHSEAMEYTETELVVDKTVEVSPKEPKDSDPMVKFLPPPPKMKCSDELQEKIIKFLSLKKTTGRSFNAEVRNRKDYRNPDFLLHAVTYQDIDQIGTCFSKDVFDPHGYDKSDFYDEIEADMKREMERKEKEKKKSQKIEYISGGIQVGTLPAPKINMPIPASAGVSSVSGGGLHTVSSTIDSVSREGRANKKSKWDKVDGDRRNPLPTGGQDPVSAAFLSASNAGTGYSAFAQQRRREAEEKKSSDKKLERRS